MFVERRLMRGDFVALIPIVYKVTIRYNPEGKIEHVFSGWDDLKDMGKEVTEKFISTNIVPRRVPISGATTHISGVLYTGSMMKQSGSLPQSIEQRLLDEWLNGRCTANFFAGLVTSFSVTFRGADPIRKWLSSAGFNILPGYLVPADYNDAKFIKMIESSRSPFKYPLIPELLVFHMGQPSVINLHTRMAKVKDVEVVEHMSGRLMARIDTDTDSMRVEYYTVIKHGIVPGCYIIIDDSNEVIWSDSKQRLNNRVTCKWCGNIIEVKEGVPTICSDPNCNSRKYPAVMSILNTLGLPNIDYNRYKEIATRIGQSFEPIDILDEPEFRDTAADIPIYKALKLGTPAEVRVSEGTLRSFCNRCNNNIKTVSYYVHNPDKMRDDTCGQLSGDFMRLVNWLKADPSNCMHIDSILFNPHIHVSSTVKKFEGQPILRNKTLLITGKFKHGDNAEIAAILSSYSAKVVEDLEDDVNCVIVGGLYEGTKSKYLKYARDNNIAIFNEDDFFNRYQIDDDLAQNL